MLKGWQGGLLRRAAAMPPALCKPASSHIALSHLCRITAPQIKQLQYELARARGERTAEVDERFGKASKTIKDLHSEVGVAKRADMLMPAAVHCACLEQQRSTQHCLRTHAMLIIPALDRWKQRLRHC